MTCKLESAPNDNGPKTAASNNELHKRFMPSLILQDLLRTVARIALYPPERDSWKMPVDRSEQTLILSAGGWTFRRSARVRIGDRFHRRPLARLLYVGGSDTPLQRKAW